jgi:hypothetical protein
MTFSPSSIRSFLIVGTTRDGERFRPSDWAERLCGVMAPFRPAAIDPNAHLTYSPFVTPGLHEGVKCVKVDARIHAVEPLAYRFLVGFASDNGLRVIECD